MSEDKTQVEEFMANLLTAGFNREKVAEKGYEYAMALQTDRMPAGSDYIPANSMAIASHLVQSAMPGAYRIHELRQRMH